MAENNKESISENYNEESRSQRLFSFDMAIIGGVCFLGIMVDAIWRRQVYSILSFILGWAYIDQNTLWLDVSHLLGRVTVNEMEARLLMVYWANVILYGFIAVFFFSWAYWIREQQK